MNCVKKALVLLMLAGIVPLLFASDPVGLEGDLQFKSRGNPPRFGSDHRLRFDPLTGTLYSFRLNLTNKLAISNLLVGGTPSSNAFLCANGRWEIPGQSSDSMMKATYDANGNNAADVADSINFKPDISTGTVNQLPLSRVDGSGLPGAGNVHWNGVSFDTSTSSGSGDMVASHWDGDSNDAIEVAHGGTNATTAAGARTNLGLGTMAVETATDYLSKAGNLAGLGSASSARSNLGLIIGTDVQRQRTLTSGTTYETITNGDGASGNPTVTLSTAVLKNTDINRLDKLDALLGSAVLPSTATTADVSDSTDKRYVTDAQRTVLGNTSGTNTGDQDLSGLLTTSSAPTTYAQRANNLSDLSSASTARTNLGLAIGTNVQAWDADLDALAGLSSTAGILKRTGAGAFGLAVAKTDYAPATSGSSILKGDGSGGTAAATSSDIPTSAEAWKVLYASTVYLNNGTFTIGTGTPTITDLTVGGLQANTTYFFRADIRYDGTSGATGGVKYLFTGPTGSTAINFNVVGPINSATTWRGSDGADAFSTFNSVALSNYASPTFNTHEVWGQFATGANTGSLSIAVTRLNAATARIQPPSRMMVWK